MAHAHKNGLIHRDLKPANILISKIDAASFFSEVNAKITDFGMVKDIVKAELRERKLQYNIERKDDLDDNIYSHAFGTPEYAAPEQWSSVYGSITKDADVYAFGIVLFEMITGGRRPYELPKEYKDPMDQVKIALYHDMHCNKQEYPLPDIKEEITKFRNDCPDSLSLLIRKCLQKHPKDRWRQEKKQQNQYQYFNTIKKHLIEIYEEDLVKERYYDKDTNDNSSVDIAGFHSKGFSLAELGKYRENSIRIFC